MFFIYFPCTIILGIIVFLDSKKYNYPRWWSAVVCLAPITAPYYIIATRGKKSLVLLTLFFVLSGFACAGEFFLYTRFKQKMHYNDYSPYAKQALDYTDQLKQGMSQLNGFIENLDSLGRVNSSLEKVNSTLDLMKTLKLAATSTEEVSKRFLLLMDDYSLSINESELAWLHHLSDYYTNRAVIKYFTALHIYVEEFSRLLSFTADNFNDIQLRNSKHQKNYDYYYLNYIRALERLNKVDIQRMAFHQKITRKYPDITSYVPVISQTRFLKVWH